MPVKARGKILREPTQNPGIVMIQGQQFRFLREGTWHSEIAPKPGLVVDVDLDNNLQVTGMWIVTDPELTNGGPTPPQPARDAMVKARRTGLFGKLMGLFDKGDSRRAGGHQAGTQKR